MLVLFGICRVFFEMPLGNSPLGMLVGSIVRTSKQAGNLGVVVGFVFLVASGVLGSPFKISGGVVEITSPTEGFGFYLDQFTPHAHANDGYRQWMLESAGLLDIGTNILALLGFAAVFFLVAIWRFKFD
jgi:ABC-type multidrug transport system permease subunit